MKRSCYCIIAPEAEVLFHLIFHQILCTGDTHDSINEVAGTLVLFPRQPFVRQLFFFFPWLISPLSLDRDCSPITIFSVLGPLRQGKKKKAGNVKDVFECREGFSLFFSLSSFFMSWMREWCCIWEYNALKGLMWCTWTSRSSTANVLCCCVEFYRLTDYYWLHLLNKTK